MTAGFQAGVAGDEQRKAFRPMEAACASCFYLIVFVQLVLFILVLASQNVKMLSEGECPTGYKCQSGIYCMADQLCDDMAKCVAENNDVTVGGRRLEDYKMISFNMSFENHMRRLADGDMPANPKSRLMRQLAARRLEGIKIPVDLWQFLEEFVEMPIVIFGATLIVSSLWLFALTKFTKPVVWGTLVFDIGLMVFGILWCLVEFGTFNYMLAALTIFFSIGLVVLRKQIEVAVVVMHKAMEGIAQNTRLVPISFGLTILWVIFFAVWIASLIGLDMSKTVGEGEEVCAPNPGNPSQETCSKNPCDFVNKYPGQWRFLWVAVYFWCTYFFNNAKLIVITAQLGEWFFKNDSADKTIWSRAVVWAFHPLRSGGANAICSAIMGFTQWLMGYVNSKCRTILAMFNPVEWIPLCLAYALKTVIHTYTKFGLVAQVYSAQPFCCSAQNAFTLLKNKLGEAVICDYVGKRVMSWCTYLLSLGVAMAALTWSNALQNYDEANDIFKDISLLIVVMLSLAYVVSMPFASIVFIVLIENMIPNDVEPKARAILNSIFASIFMGSITNFLLRTMSHIVISAMDVLYFCYAVENDLGQNQERFEDLYAAIKMTIVNGSVVNNGAVLGQPPPGQSQPNMLAVQVPEGAAPGATIQVQGPHGLIQVQIPDGTLTGQVFYVTIPPPQTVEPASEVVGIPMQNDLTQNAVVLPANEQSHIQSENAEV